MLAGCVRASESPPATMTLTYLARQSPPELVAAATQWSDSEPEVDIAAASPSRVVIRDVNATGSRTATMDVTPRADGLTEVVVRREMASGSTSPSTASPSGFLLAFADQGLDLLQLQADGSEPTCRSVDAWRQSPPPPSAPASPASVSETLPELVGGLRGLQERVFYPQATRRAGIQGTVLVSFTVTIAGGIDCVDVVASPHPDLSAAALVAVLPSRFVPATRNGAPAPVRMTVPVNFRLR